MMWIDRKVRVARRGVGCLGILFASGCAEGRAPQWATEFLNPAPEAAAAQTQVSGIEVSAQSPSEPQAQPAASASAPNPTASGVLGTTVVSLGSPSEAGLWLKTPLVTKEQAGTLRDLETGTKVAVQLIPIGGPPTAGSRISLSAMRALGVPLTALVTLEVMGTSG